MKSQLKISFFLNHAKRTKTRQTPFYLRIRYNDDQVTMATDYFITAASWDKKSKKVKGASSEVRAVNNGLNALEVKMS